MATPPPPLTDEEVLSSSVFNLSLAPGGTPTAPLPTIPAQPVRPGAANFTIHRGSIDVNPWGNGAATSQPSTTTFPTLESYRPRSPSPGANDPWAVEPVAEIQPINVQNDEVLGRDGFGTAEDLRDDTGEQSYEEQVQDVQQVQSIPQQQLQQQQPPINFSGYPLKLPLEPLDTITMKIAPEKGGVVFKHVNYIVESAMLKSSVLRRYSDFVWLHDEYLVKKFPFRILTELPPKKQSTDAEFLEQRRRQLSRFLSFIANHPVLRYDIVVLAFLKESLEFANWRKAHPIHLDSEFQTKDIPTLNQLFSHSLPTHFDDALSSHSLKQTLNVLVEKYDELCLQFEKYILCMETVGKSLGRFGEVLLELTRPSLSSTASRSIRSGHSGHDVSGSGSNLTSSGSQSPTREFGYPYADCYEPLLLTGQVTSGSSPMCLSCNTLSNTYVKTCTQFTTFATALSHSTTYQTDALLERLRLYREIVIAFRELLEKYEKTDMDMRRELEFLAKRVLGNRSRIKELRLKAGLPIHDTGSGSSGGVSSVSPTSSSSNPRGLSLSGSQQRDLDKLANVVDTDVSCMTTLEQTKIFTKHCLYQELAILHYYKTYCLSSFCRDWCEDEIDVFSQGLQCWKALG